MTDITPQLTIWIQQLRAIAQTGLAFDPHTYDRERYEALLNLAATMAATVNANASLDAELATGLAARWRADVTPGVQGYVTPKVSIGAIVFNARDELLMVQRADGTWFIPTGWADIGFSPAQVAAKEVREETGLIVTPQRLVGIYDVAHWIRKHTLPYSYSVVFYCRLDGGELRPHPVETRGAGFFHSTRCRSRRTASAPIGLTTRGQSIAGSASKPILIRSDHATQHAASPFCCDCWSNELTALEGGPHA